MDGSDFEFRKAFFQALADEPLEAGDPRYVDLSGFLERQAAGRLVETIRLSRRQSVQLFTGDRGTGKTTELKQVQARLEGAGYTVVYVDMARFLDMEAPMPLGTFWLMLILAFDLQLLARGLLPEQSLRADVWPLVFDLCREQNIKVDSASDLTYQLNNNRAFIANLREKVGLGFEIFLPQVRSHLAEVIGANGGDYAAEWVVIFDSIDHLGDTKDRLIEAIEELFVVHRDDLSVPNLHLIYSVPKSLGESPRVHRRYDYIFPLWNVNIRDDKGNRVRSAMNAFREIIVKRGGADKRTPIIHDTDTFQFVVDTSRGNLRNFLSRFRDALTHATPGKASELLRPDTVDPAKLAIGIRSLRLAHIRLFEDLTLDFTRDDKPRPFTLILAENGHGKTTVLQAIALAASGVAGANLLAGNAAAFFDRRFQPVNDEGDKFCRMEAIFDTSRRDENSTMETRFATLPTWKEFRSDGSSPMDDVRAQDKPQWFVAGYGTGRMLPRSRASKEPGRRSVDRLRSLFDAEPLVATGFADILADLLGPSVAQDYAATLRTVLIGDGQTPGLLPHDEALHVEELELRGSGAVRESTDLVDADRFVLKLGETRIKLPASWLSAGYQSTIAWVADLLGQVTLEVGRVLQPDEISGIVLIDEIDLHLHPQWQASLVPSLRAIFPKVQFIATTHSPMVLPGLRQDEIIMLSLDARGNIQQKAAPVAPALKTGSEILEWFFGIESLYPADLGQALQDYTYLATDPTRSEEDDLRMQELRRKLREAGAEPDWEPKPRIQTV